MARYRKKRSYSTKERILVHLAAGGMSEDARLPFLTQDGIAVAIRTGRSTVTKWVARLEADGLIEGERAHVPGHRIRKTTYRLTRDGWAAARRVRDRLGRDLVEVRAKGLEPLLVRTSDLPALFPAQLDLTLAVSLVREGRIDLTRLEAARAAPRAPAVWGASLRRPYRVIGRPDEIRALDAWQASGAPVLAVVGIAGIGKTSLVAHWLLARPRAGPVFWHELDGASTLPGVLGDLAACLTRLGRKGLATFLADAGRIDPGVAARTVALDLHGLSLRIVLDRAERVPAAMGKALGAFLAALSDTPDAKVLVISRTLPKFLGALPRGEGAAVLHVPSLKTADAIELLRARGLAADEATLARVAASAKGHPLLLTLIAQSGAAVSGSFDAYLEREIWTGLTPGERAALEAACILRGAARPDILRAFPDVTVGDLTGLQVKCLLEPTVAGDLGVHDLIRAFVGRKTGPRRRAALHRRAAQVFRTLPEPRDRLEALYHYLEAGRLREAAAFLDSEGSGFIDTPWIRTIADLLRDRPFGGLPPATASVFEEYLGDGLRISGDLRAAKAHYEAALRGCEATGSTARVARVLRKLGSIERIRADYPKALGYLVEARARLTASDDPAELAEILRELGVVERSLREYESAAKHLSESVDVATAASDYAAIARGLLSLGGLESRIGSKERGLEYKQEGLRMAERAGNLTEIARGHIFVGTTFSSLGRLREALSHYARSYEISKLLGNLRLKAYSAMDLGSVLIDLGRPEEAEPYVREAKDLFETLGDRENLALLPIHVGNLERERGHWSLAKEAWAAGLRELRAVGDLETLLDSLLDVSSSHSDRGEHDAARAYLEDALGLATQLGLDSVRREIQSRLDAITAASRTD